MRPANPGPDQAVLPRNTAVGMGVIPAPVAQQQARGTVGTLEKPAPAAQRQAERTLGTLERAALPAHPPARGPAVLLAPPCTAPKARAATADSTVKA